MMGVGCLRHTLVNLAFPLLKEAHSFTSPFTDLYLGKSSKMYLTWHRK